MGEFNEAQVAAIKHKKGPMLVLAGAGSGKTTVLTYRIKNLIMNREVNPKNILVLTFTKAAAKDVPKLKAAHLDGKVKALIEIIKVNPFQNPPSYEKLVGDLSGLYSRRINAQHRLVYEVVEEAQTIKILSMWSHYERL